MKKCEKCGCLIDRKIAKNNIVLFEVDTTQFKKCKGKKRIYYCNEHKKDYDNIKVIDGTFMPYIYQFYKDNKEIDSCFAD